MKAIKNIELKQIESQPLEYSFKYTLASEDRNDLITTVFSKFNSETEKIDILNNMSNWRSYFNSWDWRVDEKISKDMDKVIYDIHLITNDEESISLFEVPRFFLNVQ